MLLLKKKDGAILSSLMEKPLTAINVNVGIVEAGVHGIPKITWLIATLVALWSAPIVWSMAIEANTVPIGAKKNENPKMKIKHKYLINYLAFS